MQHDPEMVVDAFVEYLAPWFDRTGAISSVEAQQLLIKIYQLRYHFTDDATLAQRPASLVMFQKAEDPYLGSTREDHLRDFADLRIHEIFGVNFFEYLQQPRHELIQMRDRAEKYRQTKNNADAKSVSDAERKLREAGIMN